LELLGERDSGAKLRLSVSPSGDVAVAGASSRISKYDGLGRLIWDLLLEGRARINDVTFLTDGSIAVVGGLEGQTSFGGMAVRSLGNSDVFVVTVGPEGKVRSARRFGGPEGDEGVSVAEAGPGRIVVTGTTWGASDFVGSPETGQHDDHVFVTCIVAH
jgi:hypothetical protein